jgi:hypothetical protein
MTRLKVFVVGLMTHLVLIMVQPMTQLDLRFGSEGGEREVVVIFATNASSRPPEVLWIRLPAVPGKPDPGVKVNPVVGQ